MPNEFADLDAPLHPSLQPEPPCEHPRADRPVDGSAASKAEASSSAAHARTGPPDDACGECGDERPAHDQHCPGCGKWRCTRATRTRDDATHRKTLLTRAISEYQPRGMSETALVETLASSVAELRRVKHGSLRHERLVRTIKEITLTLSSRETAVDNIHSGSLTSIPTDALTGLLTRLQTESGIEPEAVPTMPAIKIDNVNLETSPVSAVSSRETESNSLSDEPKAKEQTDSSVGDPPPVAQCRYCLQTPCIGPDHQYFTLLHAHSPEAKAERAARDEYNTRSMMRQILRYQGGYR